MNPQNLQYLKSHSKNFNPPAENIMELLMKRAEEKPEDLLYVFLEDGETESDKITFQEMDRRSQAIAGILQQKVVKGDRILLVFPNGIQFISALYGVHYAACVGVPVYPPKRNRNTERFASIVEDSGAKLILTTQNIYNDIEKYLIDEPYLRGISFLIFEDLDLTDSGVWVKPEINADDLALLQYTSGSTGTPNGVMVSHGNIIHNLECIKQAFGHGDYSVGMNWLPNFHDMGLIGALIQPMYLGVLNVIIPPKIFITNPLSWLKAIEKYRASTAGGPNFSFDYVIEKTTEDERKDLDLSSLRTMFCGAEPIRKSTLESFGKAFRKSHFSMHQFYPCYGLAENVLIVTGGHYQEEPIYLNVESKSLEQGKVVESNASEGYTTFVGCGFPRLGTSVAIVDPEKSEICQYGEIGEIWVSGPSVAQGYWNKREETEGSFNIFTAGSHEGPFLRTGDLGFIKDNQLYVTGRIKDLIIIRGKNHYPHDIEATVQSAHDALQPNAGAAFSIDMKNEERLVVVQEIKRTHLRELDANAVFDAVRIKISEEHQILPYAIVLIRTGSIPKTTSGKIQRLACKRAFIRGDLTVIEEWKMNLDDKHDSHIAALDKDALRQWLINWLCTQKDLDPASIDPDKPITAYGLDSLLAVNLEKEVNENFGISWPIESFLQENTINQLVEEGERLLKEKL